MSNKINELMKGRNRFFSILAMLLLVVGLSTSGVSIANAQEGTPPAVEPQVETAVSIDIENIFKVGEDLYRLPLSLQLDDDDVSGQVSFTLVASRDEVTPRFVAGAASSVVGVSNRTASTSIHSVSGVTYDVTAVSDSKTYHSTLTVPSVETLDAIIASHNAKPALGDTGLNVAIWLIAIFGIAALGFATSYIYKRRKN